ncbi:hypothetical protein BCEP4_700014 [Burkholderia cepacia]|nr:hypothetical protein BCEP4_700014 [Burkholderia cepacia]
MPAKDVGIRIRVEKELREAFQAACIAENRLASDVIREFMQAFSERNSAGRQLILFNRRSDSRPPKSRE